VVSVETWLPSLPWKPALPKTRAKGWSRPFVVGERGLLNARRAREKSKTKVEPLCQFCVS